MRLSSIVLSVLAFAGIASGREWYEELRPGITRTEVIELAGAPSSSSKSDDKYNLRQGYLEIKYKADVVVGCTHYEPGEGIVSRSLYHTWGGDLEASHIQERKKYLESRKYLLMPDFKGPRIGTSRYGGICYMLDDGFLVVEAIIERMGGAGYLSGKTAKVTMVDSKGQSKVIYRAMDNWKELRPPKLEWKQLESRTRKILKLENDIIGKPVDEVFGPKESRMGSGLDYRLFYLKDGLAVVLVKGGIGTPNSGVISGVWIRRPGVEGLSLADWIKQTKQRLDGTKVHQP